MSSQFDLTLLTLVLGLGSGVTDLSSSAISDPTTFNFDAPGGQYQTEERTITCTVNAIQGTATFHEYRWDATYHPGIKIFLTRGTGSTQRLISLGFVAMQYHPPFVIKFGSAEDDSKDLGSLQFDTAVGQSGTFSFFVRWNADGDVAASVAGEQHTFNLGGRPDRLQINGIGGVGDVAYQLRHIPDNIGDRDCSPIS